MKRTKQEKGITLVALIITIIVLLILAVVTIAAITGDGDLISHANNAKTKYMDEAENENTTVANYITILNNVNDGLEESGVNMNGYYTFLGTDNSDADAIEINGDTVKYYDGYDNKEYVCDVTKIDENIMKLEYLDTVHNRPTEHLIKLIEEGILIIGDEDEGETEWFDYYIYVDKNKCGSKVNFTLLDGMKFNIPSEFYGGGTLEINSHNSVHYWEDDDSDDFSQCYCVYNNFCLVVDLKMQILYNEQNEIIGLKYEEHQCDRIQ